VARVLQGMNIFAGYVIQQHIIPSSQYWWTNFHWKWFTLSGFWLRPVLRMTFSSFVFSAHGVNF